mgnify:CR=1 FL=1
MTLACLACDCGRSLSRRGFWRTKPQSVGARVWAPNQPLPPPQKKTDTRTRTHTHKHTHTHTHTHNSAGPRADPQRHGAARHAPHGGARHPQHTRGGCLGPIICSRGVEGLWVERVSGFQGLGGFSTAQRHAAGSISEPTPELCPSWVLPRFWMGGHLLRPTSWWSTTSATYPCWVGSWVFVNSEVPGFSGWLRGLGAGPIGTH